MKVTDPSKRRDYEDITVAVNPNLVIKLTVTV